jgi:hypothetical protein
MSESPHRSTADGIVPVTGKGIKGARLLVERTSNLRWDSIPFRFAYIGWGIQYLLLLVWRGEQ